MLLELIDRILDKGIVIDAWARVSLLSIELLTIEARVVVASVDTYLRYAEAIGNTALASMPRPQSAQQPIGGQQQPQQLSAQQLTGLPQPQQQSTMPQGQGQGQQQPQSPPARQQQAQALPQQQPQQQPPAQAIPQQQPSSR